jgi:hypothetical protein
VLTETTPNSFQVKDGGSILGTFASISNVHLDLTNHQNKSVNVDLNGNTLAGNLFINEGTGDTTSSAAHATGIFGGHIGGSLTVVGGSGEEEVAPGLQVTNSAPFAVPMGLSVGGDISFSARSNPSPLVSNFLDTGVLFGAAAPTVLVGGGIRTTFVDSVSIGQNTTIGRNIGYTAASGKGGGSLDSAGTVGGSVQATFGNGAVGNTFELMSTGNIGGSLLTRMGNGPAGVFLQAGSKIGSTTNVSSGSGSDFYIIAGQILGNATFNAGQGTDSINVEAASEVLGNLSVSDGNGKDTIKLDGIVNGSMNIGLGNGNDTVTIGNAPGGLLSWRSGNGNDSVTFGDFSNSAGGNWNVQMHFGSGNDTLVLAGNGTVATPNALSGFIDMGGAPGVNSFDPTGARGAGTWIIIQPFTLLHA